MNQNKNAVATPLTELAYKLHVGIFNAVYSCPLHLKFQHGQASIKLSSVFQREYVPFLLIFVLVTSIIVPGSCVFLLLYKYFKPDASSAGVLELVISILLGSLSMYQVAIGLLYFSSKEIDVAINQMFFMERKYYNFCRKKSVDWLGLFYVALQPSCLPIILIAPFIAVRFKLDPFHYVFEIILGPQNQHSSYIAIPIILLRIILMAILAYETSRITILNLFVFQSLIVTISTCLRKIIRNILMMETKTLQFYNMLRVLLKSSDFFTRYVYCYLLVLLEIVMTLSMWVVIKGWNILPIYITSVFGLAATSSLVTALLIIPPAIEIGETSEKFVKRKKAKYHTFNRCSGKHQCFLKWSSQRKLPIRFGTFFIVNTRTPIRYFEVLVDNLTNAILLVDP